MKVRNISPEPRVIPFLGRTVDVDEVFDVPDDSDREWDIPDVFAVEAAPAKKKDD